MVIGCESSLIAKVVFSTNDCSLITMVAVHQRSCIDTMMANNIKHDISPFKTSSK